MLTENTITKKPNKAGSIGSVFFLFFVVLFTVGLYFYNDHLEKEVSSLHQTASQIESTIQEVEKDKVLKVFALIDANKKTIELLQERSKITKYIKHLQSISSVYKIAFRGFNISGDTVNTTVLIQSDDSGLAYEKLVKFMKGYRENANALFSLDFIDRVIGYDDMKFNISFQIK